MVRELETTPILEVNGGFLIKNKKVMGWMSRSDLLGLRWLATQATTASIVVQSDEGVAGSIRLENPKSSIDVIRKGEEVSYQIRLQATGTVQNMYRQISIQEMESLTEETLRKEMLNTFLKASSLHADPYGLSLQLYRTHPKLWRKLTEHKEEIHDETPLDLNIDVNLRYWGQRKNLKR